MEKTGLLITFVLSSMLGQGLTQDIVFSGIEARPSNSEIIYNNCQFNSTWIIEVEPEIGFQMEGIPYIQGTNKDTGCEGLDIGDNDNNTITEYRFTLDTTTLACGMAVREPPYNDTYVVTIVLPKRGDRVETGQDHLLIVRCDQPVTQWMYNLTVTSASAVFTDYNANKTTLKEFPRPTVEVQIKRGEEILTQGAEVSLGEKLQMFVTVIDEGLVYQRVKVDRLWATNKNNHLQPGSLLLIQDGCTQEGGPVIEGEPIFNNFILDDATFDVIKADFRVFRFSGEEEVYFWLDIFSCPDADEVSCILCTKVNRRKRDAVMVPHLTETRSGSLVGRTMIKLTITSPADLDHKNQAAIEKGTPEASAPSGDVCLNVSQVIILSVAAGVVLLMMVLGAAFLFRRLRQTQKKFVKAQWNGSSNSVMPLITQ